jgi:hypothetical protein
LIFDKNFIFDNCHPEIASFDVKQAKTVKNGGFYTKKNQSQGDRHSDSNINSP